MYRFGSASKLGRHEGFAVRRLITTRIIKETSQEDGRTSYRTMRRLLHGTLLLRNFPTSEQIQNGRRADEVPRDPITP